VQASGHGPERPPGLHVEGYKDRAEAALGLLTHGSYLPGWLDSVVAHRAAVTRMIRNERATRAREKSNGKG
jgi:hypothetical protein